MSLAKIGLEAVMKMAQFDAASRRYQQTTEGMQKQTEQAASGMTSALGTVAVKIGVVAGVVAAAALTIIKALKQIPHVIGSVAHAIGDLAKGAGEMQLIERAFMTFTARVGEAGNEVLAAMRKASLGMVNELNLMKGYNLAAMLVSDTFAASLPEALLLIEKVATATGESVDFLLDSFVRGVGRLSPMILDNLGIQLSLNEAYDAYAKTLGKSSDALTKQEQQLALASAAMEALRQNTAGFPDLQGTVVQRTKELAATWDNLRRILGGYFLPAWNRVLGALVDGAKSIETAIKSGGALYDSLITMGAGAAIAADGLVWLIEKAATWGINIAVQLANGIYQGAKFIIEAMQWVGNLLARWLAPGSPPRVAPDIDKWGTAAMAEYLRGFSDADFGILDRLQRPLKASFDLLARAGKMSADEAGAAYAQLSKEAIKALQTTGQLGQQVIASIRKATGEFADDILELVNREMALGKAITGVENAQRALNDARRAEVGADRRVRDLTAEYNRMLKAGASPAMLKAKLAEINAAEAERDLAQQQAVQAEEVLDSEKERLGVLQDSLSLQQKLVDALLELARAETPLWKAEKEPGLAAVKAAAGAGAAAIPERPELPAIPENIGLGMIDQMAEDIERRKEEIMQKLREMFSPLFEQREQLGEVLDGIGAKFAPVWEAAQELARVIGDDVRPFVEEALGMLLAWVGENMPLMSGTFTLAIETIQALWQWAWPWIKETALTSLQGVLAIVKQSLVVIQSLFLAITSAVKGDWRSAWNYIKQFAGNALELLRTIITIALNRILRLFGTKLSTLKEDVLGLLTKVANEAGALASEVGTGIIDGIVSSVNAGAARISEAARTAINGAISAAKSALGIQSPSKVFFEIGEQTWAGWINSTKRAGHTAAAAMREAMGEVAVAGQVAAPRMPADWPGAMPRSGARVAAAAAPTTRIINLHFGNVTISNGMDAVTFDVRVQQAVATALRQG